MSVKKPRILSAEELDRWRNSSELRKQYPDLMSYRDALKENPEMTVTAGNSRPVFPGNPGSRFLQIVNRHKQAGMSQGQAIAAAAGEDPTAHRAWVEEINRAHA